MNDRSLSCFFVREFLWQYIEAGLDKDRRLQIETHLSQCTDCTDLFKRLKTSKRILEELASTRPTAEVIEYIKKEHRFWDEAFQRWGVAQSVSTLKWVVQLSVVGVALMVTIHLFPWLNLAQSLKNMRPSTTRMAPDKKIATDSEAAPKAGPPGLTSPNPKTTSPVNESSSTFIGPRLPTAQELADLEKTRLNALAPSTPGAQSRAHTNTQKDENESGPPEVSAAEGHQTGFVWRGALRAEELNEELRDRVTKLISELGGKKAGQVELGWHQGADYYYHFILPEENYDKLLNSLNSEGFVKLVKEKHPRIIKSGYMRVIMTIEEEAASETH